MTKPRIACLLALLVTACAVVTAVTGGLEAAARWADGFVRGEGQFADGLQQGEWTFYGEGGQRRAVGRYRDDVQDGPWVYFHPNGNKEYEGTFAHERRVGLWRYWHSSGSPKAQGYFDEGRELGLWTFWDTRGQLTQRGYFLAGLQSNRWTYWHPDGARRAEGWFLDGEKIGVWTFWSPEGERSEKDFGLPAGTEIVRETWPDGAPRREGLLRDGAQHGFWVVRHPAGEVRVEGAFEDGEPVGRWVAFRLDGERLASGEVARGRPTGEWSVWTRTGRETWNASGASPAVPSADSDWSPATLADTAELGDVLATWLAEAASELAPGSVVERREPEAAPAPQELVAAVSAKPDVPIHPQPWTRRELEEYEDHIEAFTHIGSDRSVLTSRYAGRSERETSGRSPGGSPEKARLFVDKPLPLTVFKDQAGARFDVDELRGRRVVLVVLRGFGGGVCVYCTEQTGALCDAGAFERFEELGARLLVVYPGSRNALEAFKAGYQKLGAAEIPPYGLLYEQDALVGRFMDLEGNKVIPSTFILDENGIVRFAYLGEHEADRPPVELLFQELKKLGPAG